MNNTYALKQSAGTFPEYLGQRIYDFATTSINHGYRLISKTITTINDNLDDLLDNTVYHGSNCGRKRTKNLKYVRSGNGGKRKQKIRKKKAKKK